MKQTNDASAERHLLPDLSFGAHILSDFAAASSREWLVTNGIGGYASGTLSGASTRRYHGLLVAAVEPPTVRRVLVSRLEETVTFGDVVNELAANQYPGTIYPKGYLFLERFENYPAPTFFYRLRPDVLLEKTIWMARHANTVYVRYTLREAPAPLTLRLAPMICWKDYHAEMHPWEGFPIETDAGTSHAAIRATPDAPLLRMSVPNGDWWSADFWHNNIEHVRELERGLEWLEDLYCAGGFHAVMQPGETVTFTATIEETAARPEESWEELIARQKALLKTARARDPFTAALTLAADQFIVEVDKGPQTEPRPTRSTVIAGYPWFTDWGRDTMIALPGLCLSTGRRSVAKDILLSFAEYVDRGMLPNRFPDRGEAPEYNTVDATLWYFHAIWEYLRTEPAGVDAFLRRLWPVLSDIVDWHLRGTRYGIGVDEVDGLLRSGQPGVQLTWMDARVGDWVVTPRTGKAVEINALWYNALCIMAALAGKVGADSRPYEQRAKKVARSFRSAFVRPDGEGLYDVITSHGPDPAIRPNQIYAVSLPYSPLTKAEQRAVLQVVTRDLLTPVGLRTLAPSDPAYQPHYGGTVRTRDGAYHQGTVWPWLLGGYVDACLRVDGKPEKLTRLFDGLQAHLCEAGIGSISEIFDADPPHHPDGCYAQAWSVSEVLRAWRKVRESLESRV